MKLENGLLQGKVVIDYLNIDPKSYQSSLYAIENSPMDLSRES